MFHMYLQLARSVITFVNPIITVLLTTTPQTNVGVMMKSKAEKDQRSKLVSVGRSHALINRPDRSKSGQLNQIRAA